MRRKLGRRDSGVPSNWKTQCVHSWQGSMAPTYAKATMRLQTTQQSLVSQNEISWQQQHFLCRSGGTIAKKLASWNACHCQAVMLPRGRNQMPKSPSVQTSRLAGYSLLSFQQLCLKRTSPQVHVGLCLTIGIITKQLASWNAFHCQPVMLLDSWNHSQEVGQLKCLPLPSCHVA